MCVRIFFRDELSMANGLMAAIPKSKAEDMVTEAGGV